MGPFGLSVSHPFHGGCSDWLSGCVCLHHGLVGYVRAYRTLQVGTNSCLLGRVKAVHIAFSLRAGRKSISSFGAKHNTGIMRHHRPPGIMIMRLQTSRKVLSVQHFYTFYALSEGVFPANAPGKVPCPSDQPSLHNSFQFKRTTKMEWNPACLRCIA